LTGLTRLKSQPGLMARKAGQIRVSESDDKLDFLLAAGARSVTAPETQYSARGIIFSHNVVIKSGDK